MSDIIVKFKPQGDRQLVKAIRAIQNAKNGLGNATDETNKKIMAQYNNFFEPEYNVSQHDDYFDRKEKRRRHSIFCTSCEHMDDLDTKQYYKGNPFLCLQSPW